MDTNCSRKKKYRVRSKFRFTVFLVIMTVAVVFTAGTILGLNDAASLSELKTTQVEIQAGDTLWDIATEYGPQNKDRRQVVYEICKLNDISANSLQPGQVILVPEKI